MGIPATFYGRAKVCLWTYFDTPPLHDGTSFFVDNRTDYLPWVWDIPISPTQTSVGLVLPADTVRDQRRAGATVESILRGGTDASRPVRPCYWQASDRFSVEATSFRPYVTAKVCGANWLMVGEAASMPDPLTGNGVTSGIRHARARGGRDLWPAGSRHELVAWHAARPTAVTSSGSATAFNAHIERVVYRPELRQGLGLQAATYVYTLFAFFMNALHARFDPRGRVGMAAFAVLFVGARSVDCLLGAGRPGGDVVASGAGTAQR